jgi:mycothiol system anti-sigma-R factor
MINCPEAVRRMWAYLGASLEPGPTVELEAHLEVCKRCCGELEFSRQLRGLVATSSAPPMPDELRDRVTELLTAGHDSGSAR